MENTEINQKFICKFNNCKKYFEIPVLLPCNSIICKRHIDKLYLKKDGQDNFECQFCNEVHKIPIDGFIIDEKLMEIINSSSHLIGLHKKVMIKLQEMELLINELDTANSINYPECYIYDYFHDLRNKIDLQREILIKKINELSDQMLDQLNECEKDCKKNFEENLQPIIKKKNLLKNDLNVTNFKNVLRDPYIDHEILNLNYNLIQKNIEKINFTINKSKHDLLTGKSVIFQPAVIEKNLLGKLIINKSNIVTYNSNIKFLLSFSGHQRSVKKVLINEKMNILISGSYDQTIKIWNLSTGYCIKSFLAHQKFISCLSLYQENKIISSSADFTIKLWNITDSKCLDTLKFSFIVHTICLLKNQNVAFGFKNGHIIIWDIENRKKIGDTMIAHKSRVSCLKALDSNSLISASRDKSIKVWDLENRQLLNTFNSHNSEVNCLEIIHNNILISGSTDRSIKMWDLTNYCLIKTILTTTSVIAIKYKSERLIIGLTNTIAIYDLRKKYFVMTFGELGTFINGIELLSNGNICCHTFNNFKIKIISNNFI